MASNVEMSREIARTRVCMCVRFCPLYVSRKLKIPACCEVTAKVPQSTLVHRCEVRVPALYQLVYGPGEGTESSTTQLLQRWHFCTKWEERKACIW